MIHPALEEELHQHLNKLPREQQQQVLDFARTLSSARVHGVPGESLIRFGGGIQAADLTAIMQAIEDDCEKAALDDW